MVLIWQLIYLIKRLKGKSNETKQMKQIILIAILMLILSGLITHLVLVLLLVMDSRFGKKVKVKALPMPSPPVTEETLLLWQKCDPKRLKNYLENLKPIWIITKINKEIK